ncbi:MAG TPA: Ig-like domain-containing protein, partial [Candidatus Saccharimonadales bacterium]|nr:Ig-like domain-containing protein [Candidatus Saccharimonadales bacterium]
MKRIISTLIALLFIATNALPLMGSGVVSADPINLIPNPSVESETSGNPTSWANSKQGTNTVAFSYLNTGHTGSRSLEINMTNRSSGSARWYFSPVNVTPNTTYTYSDWYKSNKTTYLQPVITRTNGRTTNMTQTSVAASTDWKQVTRSITTPANAKSMTVYHLIKSVGKLTTDDFALSPPATPPVVQITSPVNNSTVSGSQSVSANVTDDQGVAGVQFKVDGANLGSEDTVAPYGADWNTTAAANGAHTISAVARNTVNLTATTSVNVDVQNSVTPPPPPPPVDEENLFANGSVETATSGSPDNWLKNSWGTNTAQFIYEDTGRTGSHSVTTSISQITSGDAKWYPSPVSVVAGKTYVYRDFYKSDVSNRVVVAFIDGSGNYSYVEQPSATASAAWKQYDTSFVIPSTAVQATVFHLIDSVGSLTVDDILLSVGVPPVTDINVPNGSLEEGSTSPTGWQNNNWGSNTASFQYVNNDGHSGSKSAKVTVSNYVDGDAKWFFTPISTLTPGTQYRFTAWYKGSALPHAVALYIKADGTE